MYIKVHTHVSKRPFELLPAVNITIINYSRVALETCSMDVSMFSRSIISNDDSGINIKNTVNVQF